MPAQGTAERAPTKACHPRKANGSQSLQKKIGQLSGHLRAVKLCQLSKYSAERKWSRFQAMKCGPKGQLCGHLLGPAIQNSKRSQSLQYKRDSWAGTYFLWIVDTFIQKERSQFSKNNMQNKRDRAALTLWSRWKFGGKVRRQEQRSQFLQYNKGPLSGHVPPPVIQKFKKSRRKSVRARKWDSWAGTYSL